ncbi:MAG TPA: GTP cyclohydrolase II RibA [Bryobacteraceae bacterium]|nr:GTP cyclohydrolase II RibA [Bryobacteraceae bacterium]
MVLREYVTRTAHRWLKRRSAVARRVAGESPCPRLLRLLPHLRFSRNRRRRDRRSGSSADGRAFRRSAAASPHPLSSQCLTGDVFHSLRCDCRAQLEIALKHIAQEGRGLLIYEHQEGRGIGLLNKLRAYEPQDQGADTVEANQRLGFENDLRSYKLPAAILGYFGLEAVRLLSNNPEKVEAVERAGIRVSERVPCLADVIDTREAYLRTKKEKMGHWPA